MPKQSCSQFEWIWALNCKKKKKTIDYKIFSYSSQFGPVTQQLWAGFYTILSHFNKKTQQISSSLTYLFFEFNL